MAIIDYQVKPCPKCGGRILARGAAVKCTTPKVLRPFLWRYGVTCVRCGYWKYSIKAWKRRAGHGNV